MSNDIKSWVVSYIGHIAKQITHSCTQFTLYSLINGGFQNYNFSFYKSHHISNHNHVSAAVKLRLN